MRVLTLSLLAALAFVVNRTAQERPGAQKPQVPPRQTQQGAKTPPMAPTPGDLLGTGGTVGLNETTPDFTTGLTWKVRVRPGR